MIGQYDWQQLNPLQNAQYAGQINPEALGQQPFGQHGYGPLGQVAGLGQAALGYGLGQHMGPMGGGMQSPWAITQAQQHPQLAFGAFGQRMPTQQDVSEVVRQLLPAVAQIAAQMQGQAATGHMYQQPLGQQQPFGPAYPQLHAAYGSQTQRQLTQQDVSEVVRQLAGIVPQVIQHLQATGQQRWI
jgi:uncharacterized protein YidB (DUF937 family)